MSNVIAYAVRFDNADLSDSNFSNGELLKSVFDGAIIDGTDFTDANLDLSQRKSLCERATGTNSKTGVDCLLYTSPSPRDKRQSRMPSSA